MGIEDLDKLDAQFAGTDAAKRGSFDPIPVDAKVKVVVKNQKGAIVGANQTKVCKVTFETVLPDQYAGKRIWHDFWLTDANLKYLKRDLITLGWLNPDGSLPQGKLLSQLMSADNQSLIGLGAEVTVGQEPYSIVNQDTGQEEMRIKNTIKFFNSTYKYVPPPKDAGAPDTASPPDAPPTGQPGQDDDIPF
jgi:hypothetical protein